MIPFGARRPRSAIREQSLGSALACIHAAVSWLRRSYSANRRNHPRVVAMCLPMARVAARILVGWRIGPALLIVTPKLPLGSQRHSVGRAGPGARIADSDLAGFSLRSRSWA